MSLSVQVCRREITPAIGAKLTGQLISFWKGDAMRIASWLAAALTCGALLQVSGNARQPAPLTDGATATLVDRMVALDTPLISYRAFRTLTAETRGGEMHAKLTAWTSLDPIEGFRYSIVEEDGSGFIRQKVFHAALETEQKMWAAGGVDAAAFTRTNYNFADGTRTEEGVMRIGIKPKRPDILLVDGCILVTDPGADLVRIEGVLSKRPSFWTREVRVVRHYARIVGISVPTEMHSVAHVLFLGPSTFSVVYDYASINGSPVPPIAMTAALEAAR
jgi:hypothetical protein